ncbi:hypothetical protein ETD86_19510 [Nonomuraea turkmeniaca]|uniref:Uncharacterized protein n=1 Tax=Nonomuraea turkmeniaca TaxID=103838 RepID=A0A5S4FHR6_9ACTN|nr:hypothetical protein ETD86_19510 [Nonomuraea turkmeniaca]
MRPHAAARRSLPSSPFYVAEPPPAPPIEQFTVRDQVSHDKYGLGRVIAVEQNVAVLVDFGAETRRINAPYVKLVKL